MSHAIRRTGRRRTKDEGWRMCRVRLAPATEDGQWEDDPRRLHPVLHCGGPEPNHT